MKKFLICVLVLCILIYTYILYTYIKIEWTTKYTESIPPMQVAQSSDPLPLTPVELPQYNFTEEEVTALAKLLWGEARGVKSDEEKKKVVWTVLNRVDSEYAYYPTDIVSVITQANQFTGYRASNPVEEEFVEIAKEVLYEWYLEKDGYENIDRNLDADIYHFYGNGSENIFYRK